MSTFRLVLTELNCHFKVEICSKYMMWPRTVTFGTVVSVTKIRHLKYVTGHKEDFFFCQDLSSTTICAVMNADVRSFIIHRFVVQW